MFSGTEMSLLKGLVGPNFLLGPNPVPIRFSAFLACLVGLIPVTIYFQQVPLNHIWYLF